MERPLGTGACQRPRHAVGGVSQSTGPARPSPPRSPSPYKYAGRGGRENWGCPPDPHAIPILGTALPGLSGPTRTHSHASWGTDAIGAWGIPAFAEMTEWRESPAGVLSLEYVTESLLRGVPIACGEESNWGGAHPSPDCHGPPKSGLAMTNAHLRVSAAL
jgi:hypothetical protein